MGQNRNNDNLTLMLVSGDKQHVRQCNIEKHQWTGEKYRILIKMNEG